VAPASPILKTARVPTPSGWLLITAAQDAIMRVRWARPDRAEPVDGEPDALDHPLLARAQAQLTAYFAGRRRAFDLPLAPEGQPLERAVWDAMLEIPYGQTRTYGEIARALGSAPQPVGQACGANPIPILIPCHRVVGADGATGGFSGGAGVETKLALLRLEGALLL